MATSAAKDTPAEEIPRAEVPEVAAANDTVPLPGQALPDDAPYRDRLAADWSQYVTVGPVILDGVLAAPAGAAWPASHPQTARLLDEGYVRAVDVPAEG